jgi:hypothetical protein
MDILNEVPRADRVASPEYVADLYDKIEVRGEHDFLLSGADEAISVPLRFDSDIAFILKAALSTGEDGFTQSDILELPGYREVCRAYYPDQRFATDFTQLLFVLKTLGSSLLEVKGRRRGSKAILFQVNPEYTVSGLPLTVDTEAQ